MGINIRDKLFPRAKRIITIRKAIGAFASYHNSSFRWRLHYNRPFATLTKTETKAHVILDTKNEERLINFSELKIGGSFPLDYHFLNFDSAISLIGNSVPPLFMYAIAGTIRERLFGNYIMPDRNGNEYLDILEAAWQEHLKPREIDAPTVVSLFAGCGGSSLGYSMAGFRELLAVEWDDNAVATFKLNFSDIPVYHGDIHNLSVNECLELMELEPGKLDVLDGSPPCQGFSTAGKRQMDDKRNQLYMEYIRLLRGLKPKVLIMENVSGLVKGKMKLIFADIMRELKASGYMVSCRLMNTMYFNVPQSRQRLIWIGVREDLEIEPGHPRGEDNLIPISNAIVKTNSWNELTPIQLHWWKRIEPGQSGSDVHPSGHWFNFHKLHPDEPAPALPASAGNAKFCHWLEPVALGINQYKRIASFPDSWRLTGTYGNKKNRLGNSVPPLFMKSIAEHVRSGILDPQRID